MNITPPLTDETVKQLRSGDRVLITGTVYIARDAAHKRFIEAQERGDPLPFDPTGQIVWYAGPAQTKPGRAIGSTGPTTSYRMDPYTPQMLVLGLKGMIGKGPRSPEVRQAIMKHRAVYFLAIGGVAALLTRSIRKAEIIAYEDLGPEAVRRLEVEDFPVIVINDLYGGDAYEEGQAKYRMK